MTYGLAPGLTAVGVGTIISEDSTKDAQLFQTPIPASDSDAAILLDLFGVVRTINIKGVYTAADGTISTFVQALDALVSGSQVAQTFTSDKSGTTYTGYVTTVTWSSEEGGVSKVDYNINLVEGNV